MAKSCEICGKHLSFGNQVAHRGMAKYLGGVGVKVTGVTRRKFQPNVQKLRVSEHGGNRTARVCTRCLKSGVVTKATKREIPDEVRKKMKDALAAKTPEARRAKRKARKQARLEAEKAAAAAKAKKGKGGPATPPPQPPKKK